MPLGFLSFLFRSIVFYSFLFISYHFYSFLIQLESKARRSSLLRATAAAMTGAMATAVSLLRLRLSWSQVSERLRSEPFEAFGKL